MLRVLVVEDEDVLLEMIAALLEDLGYESIVATNGAEALSLLAQIDSPPALILSDVMMPRMNGLEFIHAIRADSRYAHTPIILMSAGGRPADIKGVDYFLHKPFNIDQLATLMLNLLSKQQQ